MGRTQAQPGMTDAAELAAQYADDLIVDTVRDMHRAISGRAFGATGQGGVLTRVVHDGISETVYGAVSASFQGVAEGLRRVKQSGYDVPLDNTVAGRQIQSAVNALIGERLRDGGHPMSIRMAARIDGRDVTDFVASYPRPTGNVVLFLHGLGENDESWQLGRAESGGTYAERLARDTDWTPVVMRYNTGLHISDNGRRLSTWLGMLVREWPVPVRRIALVGHSMGGLVARAACHCGAEEGSPWTKQVTTVVCLGSPHAGSPVEQVVHLGAAALSVFPESTPFARILNTRSPGITDLRHGYVTDADWADVDLNKSWGDAAREFAPLPHASYHCVVASVGGVAGYLAGDFLVRRSSAAGRIDGADVRHLARTHHFALLNHPEVYDDLVRWLHNDQEEPNHGRQSRFTRSHRRSRRPRRRRLAFGRRRHQDR